MVTQLSLFQQKKSRQHICLRCFVATLLHNQEINPDSITQIAELANRRKAASHLTSLYSILAKNTISVIEVNATGIIRLLNLDAEDAKLFRQINRYQRTIRGRESARACNRSISISMHSIWPI